MCLMSGGDVQNNEFVAINEHSEDYLEDKAEDRVHDQDLVGKRFEVLYAIGWFQGDILYYNQKLKEYKVNFSDSRIDSFSRDDGLFVLICI